MRRLSWKLRAFLLLLLLAAFATLGVWLDYRAFLERPIDRDSDRNIVVTPGMSAGDIVDLLAAEGLVESPRYLRFYLWRSGKGTLLQPGSYAIEPGTTVVGLVDLLTRGGDDRLVHLVLQPGTNLWELAELLHELRLADRQAFLRRATDAQYAAELGVPAPSLEGYLLPGRYGFERGVAVDELIETLHTRFRETWVELVRAHPEAVARARARRQMGDHELVTLASVVEREAVVDRECAVIARVFYNRLDVGMKLQSDPTCVYPPATPGEVPSPARCRDPQSRYSTYVNEGLPPGPIGAPSASSLAAVLAPYDGRDAASLLFFVARNDRSWTHYFSSTYEEHQAAVAHFLKHTRPQPPRGTRQP